MTAEPTVAEKQAEVAGYPYMELCPTGCEMGYVSATYPDGVRTEEKECRKCRGLGAVPSKEGQAFIPLILAVVEQYERRRTRQQAFEAATGAEL